MPRLEIDATCSIWYDVLNKHSTATPVVLIQGFSGVAADWHRLATELAKDRPVVIFDNRGIGDSAVPDGAYPLKLMADDCIRLMTHLGYCSGYKRFHVMGISMGGMIAQEVALDKRVQKHIGRLILGCTDFGGTSVVPPAPGFLKMMGNPTLAKTMGREAFMRKVMEFNYTAEWVKARPHRFEAYVQEFLRHKRSVKGITGQAIGMNGWCVKERLKNLKIGKDTMVLHGNADLVVPYSNGVALAKAIPGSLLHTLDGCGHVFWDMDDEESAVVVRKFLRFGKAGLKLPKPTSKL